MAVFLLQLKINTITEKIYCKMKEARNTRSNDSNLSTTDRELVPGEAMTS